MFINDNGLLTEDTQSEVCVLNISVNLPCVKVNYNFTMNVLSSSSALDFTNVFNSHEVYLWIRN